MNIGEVYFTIRGTEVVPEAVTAALGATPTRTLVRADPTPKFSSWELSSGKVCAEAVDVYELAELAIRPLLSKVSLIRAIAESFQASVTLQVVLTISLDEREATPAIGFSEAVVRFLSSVGASIDIDTYRGAS